MPDVDRRPSALAFATILTLSSTSTALGFTPLPGSLQSSPGVYGQGSAIFIWVGSLVVVAGIIIGWVKDYLDGLVIEQAGLILSGIGCTFYGIALFGVEHISGALLAMGLSFGLAAYAIVQTWLIGRYRKRRLDLTNGR